MLIYRRAVVRGDAPAQAVANALEAPVIHRGPVDHRASRLGGPNA